MAVQWGSYVALFFTVVASVAIADAVTVEEILTKNGLPPGLLPGSVKSYTLSDNGKFKVELDSPCYAKIGNDVYYAPTITGDLGFGEIRNLVGIQAKEGWFWFAVTGIVAKSKTITFVVGPFSKDLDINMFSSPPTCNNKVAGKTFSCWLSKALNGDLAVNVGNILEENFPRKMLQ